MPSNPTCRELTIAARVRSLCWQGEDLIDWAGGGAVYRLDGSSERMRVNYAYRFDAAVVSPTGTYAVIYERLGTKGLVLKDGKILREINRSFYHANAYEYPVALGQLPGGDEVLIHCPESYCRLDIELAESGERLTSAGSRSPSDFFHSRLAINATGTRLLSAGWVWHPFGMVRAFDLEEALVDPRHLDSGSGPASLHAEVESAAFVDEHRVAIATTEETADDDDESPACGPGSVCIYDLRNETYLSTARCNGPIGTIFPVDLEHFVSVFSHPKLRSFSTGGIRKEWPEIASGRQRGSILSLDDGVPPMAFDQTTGRLAVAGEGLIRVIELLG
jgi:hypothetical protein